jgi:hypothetical protein
VADDDYVHLDPTLEAPENVDGRTWGKTTYVAIVHPEPTQRAIEVTANAAVVPRNARLLATLAATFRANVRITHAIGEDTKPSTGLPASVATYELTGEETPGGKPAKKEIGSTPVGPVNSVRVVIQDGDMTYVGHWVANGWDSGMILKNRVLVQNCNWTQLDRAVKNAKSQADMRGESDGQLEMSFPGD